MPTYNGGSSSTSSSSRDRSRADSRDRAKDRSRDRHGGSGSSPDRRRRSSSSSGRPPAGSSSTSSSSHHHHHHHHHHSSSRYDSSPETKLAFFIKSVGFIVDMGKALNLGKVATHTALVFFHRFFKHQPFHAHDRLLVGAACIYLAAKVEERNNVKLSLIVVEYLKSLGVLPSEVDPNEYNRNAIAREEVPAWKSRVITYERAILYTIAFDLNVTHPFKALQDMMKTVREVMSEEGKKTASSTTAATSSSTSSSSYFSSSTPSPASATPFNHRTFFSQASKFLNDSFCLPSMIEVEPSYSAALALYLTAMLYDIKPPTHKGTWLDIFKVQDESRFLNDCLLAVRTYAEESFALLNVKGVPDPLSIPLATEMEVVSTSSYGGGGGGRRKVSPLLY